MELILLPLAFLYLIKIFLTCMGVLFIIGLFCTIVGCVKCLTREDELSPCTKEAKDWKKKVDDQRRNKKGN